MRTVFSLALFSALFLFSGCSESNPFDTVQATGTVKVDGAPTEGVKVVFHPTGDGNPGFATTDAQGKYVLSFPSAPAGAGVPVGTYQPTFSKMETEKREPTASPEEEFKKYGNKPPKTIYHIPKKYSEPKNCGIEPVNIESGKKNVFDFELTSK